jgi:uncharacterized protein with FMN-binding domain
VRRALVALILTAAAVTALARYHTHPPRTLNLRAAHPDRPAVRAAASRARRGVRTVTGPPMMTPFSLVQVRVTLTDGRLTDVETVSLTGDGPHTQALNARAEPILRREALRARSAHIDTVSGATYTSRVWIQSLRAAIEAARHG